MHDDAIITELDLSGYVDNLLEPQRRAEVEAYLAKHPDVASRIAAYRKHRDDVRVFYASVVEEPVPERLRRTVRGNQFRNVGTRAVQYAAAAALVSLVGLGGWLIGSAESNEHDNLERFARHARESATDSAGGSTYRQEGIAPFAIQWFAEEVSLEIRQPNLEHEGLRLLSKEAVLVAGNPAVRLVYAGDDERTATLYLRTRWSDERPPIEVNEDVAYWADGPIIFALTGTVDEKELHALATVIDKRFDIQPGGPVLTETAANTRSATGSPMEFDDDTER